MTTPTVTERGRLTALRAAWLFDGTGSTLIPDPLVVIDGGTIVAVDSGTPAPDGADVIDLGGAALLPGLVDTHVHLAFDASADPVGALAAGPTRKCWRRWSGPGRRRCAAASPRSGTWATGTTCRWGCAAGRGCRRSSRPGRRSPRRPGIATTWAGWRCRPRRGCGPRCASTWSAASTSSRSWPAAGP